MLDNFLPWFITENPGYGKRQIGISADGTQLGENEGSALLNIQIKVVACSGNLQCCIYREQLVVKNMPFGFGLLSEEILIIFNTIKLQFFSTIMPF